MRRTLGTVPTAGLALAMVIALCAPAGAQDEPIYETRFGDPEQSALEWELPEGVTSVTDDGYTTAFTPGALTVSLETAPNAWHNPYIADLPRDQAVEALIASSTGDASALFGVGCRADLPNVGYVLLVGTDGFYTIGRYAGGKGRRSSPRRSRNTPTSSTRSASTSVRGECVGKKKVKLTLFVNDEKIVSVVDKSPPKKFGTLALIVNEVTEGEQATTEYAGFSVDAL